MSDETKFWESYYQKNQLPWDRGQYSLELYNFCQEFFKTAPLNHQEINALVPGFGSGNEIKMALDLEINKVCGIELSSGAVKLATKNLVKYKKKISLINGDLLNGDLDYLQSKLNFNIVIERAMFCAIKPIFTGLYIQNLLKINNDLKYFIGVFNVNEQQPTNVLDRKGPPFGISKNELLATFKSYGFKPVKSKTIHEGHPPETFLVCFNR